MSTKDEQTRLSGQTEAEVDRIRDIIFGSQMRQYEQRFQRLVQQTELLGKQLEELRGALDQQRSDQEARSREIQEELRQRHAELDNTLSSQVTRLETSFGQKTAQMQDEFRQALNELRTQAFSRMDQQGTDVEARMRRLAADMRQQDQALQSEFAAALAALEDAKTDRLNLGDLLVEMGMRLKQQASLADLLGQLETPVSDPPAE